MKLLMFQSPVFRYRSFQKTLPGAEDRSAHRGAIRRLLGCRWQRHRSSPSSVPAALNGVDLQDGGYLARTQQPPQRRCACAGTGRHLARIRPGASWRVQHRSPAPHRGPAWRLMPPGDE